VQDDVSLSAAEKSWKPVVVTRVSGSVLKNGGKPAIQPRVSGLPPPGNSKRCSVCTWKVRRVSFLRLKYLTHNYSGLNWAYVNLLL
jgi:hypothetical protein